jgi:hypothetical protein
MRLKINRNNTRSANPNAYWRRRFFILAGSLALLALLAWLLPGRHPGPSAGVSAAARASMAALQSQDALPSAAYGSAWPVPSPKPSATATPTPAAKASPNPKTTPSGSKISAGPHPTASGSAAGIAPCKPGDIVLSLLVGQASYSQDARPQFNVYAVSTAASQCQMAYGAGSVRVIVTRNGQVVWDSAGCKPPAAKTVRFQRGVPQLLTISWNRSATSPPGCAGSLPAGAWGTFQAVAMITGQTSPVRTFTLLR